jgi:hypothetical protein
MSDDVKVGNFNKPAKRPTPKAPAPVAETTESSGGASLEEVNAKMDKILEFMQAIDWKMWVYLKANNYID